MVLKPVYPERDLALAETSPRTFSRVGAYLDLTRPRVLLLVLFTAPPALLLGQAAMPGLLAALTILAGTALIGGSCGAFNAYIERESDALMARTRSRPLPSGQLSPGRALAFAWVTGGLGVLLVGLAGGPLAAAVGAAGLFHYVVIYTLWLKPRTAQNIVIGGAAGAVAPLIADVAADGVLDPIGWLLFAVVVLWTPPHFWAIALYRAKEYAAAGIPMMPAVVGAQGTRWRMLAYAILLVPATLAVVPAAGLSMFYGAVALGAGLWFIGANVHALRQQNSRADRRVFAVSIGYLTLVFTALLIECVL